MSSGFLKTDIPEQEATMLSLEQIFHKILKNMDALVKAGKR
jgi:hypothetical protein